MSFFCIAIEKNLLNPCDSPTRMAIFRRLSGSRFDAPETILYAAK